MATLDTILFRGKTKAYTKAVNALGVIGIILGSIAAHVLLSGNRKITVYHTIYSYIIWRTKTIQAVIAALDTPEAYDFYSETSDYKISYAQYLRAHDHARDVLLDEYKRFSKETVRLYIVSFWPWILGAATLAVYTYVIWLPIGFFVTIAFWFAYDYIMGARKNLLSLSMFVIQNGFVTTYYAHLGKKLPLKRAYKSK